MAISSADVDRVLAALESSAAEGRAFAFAIEAVKDIQGTIRAIDTKVGILLAVQAIPLSAVQSAFAAAHAGGLSASPATLAGALAFLVWVAAAFVAIRTLTAVGDASKHVRAERRPADVFYAGGHFRFGWFDALLTRDAPVSRGTIEQYAADIPSTAEDVNLHLAFEVLSLAYIRDLKIHRQKVAFELTALAIALGVLALVLPR